MPINLSMIYGLTRIVDIEEERFTEDGYRKFGCPKYWLAMADIEVSQIVLLSWYMLQYQTQELFSTG